MDYRLKQVLVAACVLAIAGCAKESEPTVSEQVCEDVLASFFVVPISEQTRDQRRAMLETIKAEQEAKFGEVCERFPGWRERFEAAYHQAT